MANIKIGKTRRGKEGMRGRMPTKKSINLVKVDEKQLKIGIAIPAIILIILLAAVFSKFFVIDRFAEMDAAYAEVVRLRNQADMFTDALKGYQDVEDVYAHYTKADMTEGELTQVDRVMVLDLVESVLPTGNGSTKTWNVKGNILTIEVAESTLGKQNELTKKIEESPIVDRCTIVTANKDREKIKGAEVRAVLTVYLKQPEEEEAEEESAAASTDMSSGEAAESSESLSSEKTADESAGQYSEDVTDESAGQSSEDVTDGSVNVSSDETSDGSADLSAEGTAERPMGLSSKESSEGTADLSSARAADGTVGSADISAVEGDA